MAMHFEEVHRRIRRKLQCLHTNWVVNLVVRSTAGEVVVVLATRHNAYPALPRLYAQPSNALYVSTLTAVRRVHE